MTPFDTKQFHEQGYATVKELPIHLSLPGFFFVWIADINEIVGNLNLVLNDIKMIAEKPWLLEGSPEKRLRLFIRVYFYEFYRFREIFNEAMAALRKAGYLTRHDGNLVRKAFNDAFEQTISMRNQLTHARINWSADHVDLMIADLRRELGHMVVDIDTRNEVTVDNFLQKLCPKYYNSFYAEGQRICKVFQALINNMADRFIEKDNIHLKKDG